MNKEVLGGEVVPWRDYRLRLGDLGANIQRGRRAAPWQLVSIVWRVMTRWEGESQSWRHVGDVAGGGLAVHVRVLDTWMNPKG